MPDLHADRRRASTCYLRDVKASVGRPVREHTGLTKVTPEPGASRQVSIGLDQRAFSCWSKLHGTSVVEAGEFAIEVGHHSRDLPLRHTVAVDAPSIAALLAADSTLHDRVADPVGLALIRKPAPPASPTRPATPSSSQSSAPSRPSGATASTTTPRQARRTLARPHRSRLRQAGGGAS